MAVEIDNDPPLRPAKDAKSHGRRQQLATVALDCLAAFPAGESLRQNYRKIILFIKLLAERSQNNNLRDRVGILREELI